MNIENSTKNKFNDNKNLVDSICSTNLKITTEENSSNREKEKADDEEESPTFLKHVKSLEKNDDDQIIYSTVIKNQTSSPVAAKIEKEEKKLDASLSNVQNFILESSHLIEKKLNDFE